MTVVSIEDGTSADVVTETEDGVVTEAILDLKVVSIDEDVLAGVAADAVTETGDVSGIGRIDGSDVVSADDDASTDVVTTTLKVVVTDETIGSAEETCENRIEVGGAIGGAAIEAAETDSTLHGGAAGVVIPLGA